MRKNQRGFGGVAILLIVLAVLAIGGAAYYVWNQSKKDEKPAAQTAQSADNTYVNPATPTTTADKNVVEIKELGIKITVPDSIKDVTYTVKTTTTEDGRELTVAYFSTQKLTDLDSGCSSDNISPLGALGKATGTFNAATSVSTLVKQYPAYYVDYASAQAACSDNASTVQLSQDSKTELVNSLPSIEEL